MRSLYSIMVVFFLALSVLFSTVSVSEAYDNAEAWNQYQRERYCERMWERGEPCNPYNWNGTIYRSPRNSGEQRANCARRMMRQGRDPSLCYPNRGYYSRTPRFPRIW